MVGYPLLSKIDWMDECCCQCQERQKEEEDMLSIDLCHMPLYNGLFKKKWEWEWIKSQSKVE